MSESFDSYEILLEDFTRNSSAILPSKLSNYQSLITVLLAILSFVFVSSTLLNRKSNVVVYILNALLASGSVALMVIYACNFFGVYI